MLESFDREFLKIETDVKDVSRLPKISTLKTGIGDRPLALYGGGLVLGFALAYCKKENLKPLCICDTYRPGTHEISGLPIILPEQLRRDHPDALVLISTFQYEEQITEHLLKLGVLKENIYLFRFPARVPLDEFMKKHYHGYKWAYEFFGDQISKKLVLDLARSFLTPDIILPAKDQNDKYFDSEFISLDHNEIFIDGGACAGNITEDFIKRVNGLYGHIYAFEPDPDNYKKAAEKLSKYPNTNVIPKGLWDSEAMLGFARDKYNPEDSSFVMTWSEFSTIEAPVTSLDNFFDGKPSNELPTFIKLDIEGAEKRALFGAARIIKQKKPKLTLCMYHKVDDIYELPQAIFNLRDDYMFTLRQYHKGYFGTILYVI